VSAGHETLNGIFIAVEVADSVRTDAELARRLEEACPVDIFSAGESGVQIVPENLDECVLCELCLATAPPGTVRVVKLYDEGAALEHAPQR
jgi:NAD-dependent dihydropyrimidine dehydrogenase PreA subunit